MILLLISGSAASAQNDSLSFNGQVIGWTGVNYSSNSSFLLGARFIPDLYYLHTFKNNLKFDAELAANAYAAFLYEQHSINDGDPGVRPYRATLRLSSEQWEVRAGLQKISFGSATLLRPLMWFDGTDPRDPLHLTEGVYGVLGRYYFLNNTNLWIWGLYGNHDLRGWDYLPAGKHTPEFGGRVQIPFLHGDLGFSYHHRHPGADDMRAYGFSDESIQYNEDKAGIDGKWDIGPGIWFEYVLKHNSVSTPRLPDYESYLDLGTDYTFKWGNGLNIILEHFYYKSHHPVMLPRSNLNLSAAALAYPMGFGERISLMVYHDWEENAWYRFLNISKDYDHLSLYLIFFWNPENTALYSAMKGAAVYTGKGFELMASYNF